MTGPLKAAIGAGITEVDELVGDVPVCPHGETPGNQSVSSCPGRHIKAWLKGQDPDATAEVRAEIEIAREALGRALELLEAN
jgi:hypothetical protein